MNSRGFSVLLLAYLVLATTGFAQAGTKSRVVVAHDPKAIHHFDANPDRVRQLTERGILALTGKQQLADAWREFAGSNDVVGIKIVARGGPLFSVHKDLVAALVSGLEAAGVPEQNIIVWDKYQSDLVDAGYQPGEATNRVSIVGVIPSVGFDPDVKYHSPTAGKIIWGDYVFGHGEEISGDSHVAQIVTRQVTKLINISVLSDHSEMGLSGCLLNLALGSVDNVRRFQNDPSACEYAVAEICSMPGLHDKTVLHVIDGLLSQYALGPNFHPEFTRHHGTIYFSKDPVALDTIALEEIESQRKHVGMYSVSERARYIRVAASAGLGRAKQEEIDLVKVGGK